MKPCRRVVALVLCLCLLPSTGAAVWEDSSPLPCALQLTLLGKVLSFDRTLTSRTTVLEIGVLYQADYPESEAAKADFMRATKTLAAANTMQLRFKPINIEGKPGFRDVFRALNVEAVYVMPLRGLDISALTRAAAASGVRTFSGVPEYVYEGVSVTVGTRQGRPVIYVNLKTARAQGSDFSSQLLKLANVIE